jgi:hypothetical protein
MGLTLSHDDGKWRLIALGDVPNYHYTFLTFVQYQHGTEAEIISSPFVRRFPYGPSFGDQCNDIAVRQRR